MRMVCSGYDRLVGFPDVPEFAISIVSAAGQEILSIRVEVKISKDDLKQKFFSAKRSVVLST